MEGRMKKVQFLTQEMVDDLVAKKNKTCITDGGGLRLLIDSAGRPYWNCQVRVDGKIHGRFFGRADKVALAIAREKASEFRQSLPARKPARKPAPKTVPNGYGRVVYQLCDDLWAGGTEPELQHLDAAFPEARATSRLTWISRWRNKNGKTRHRREVM